MSPDDILWSYTPPPQPSLLPNDPFTLIIGACAVLAFLFDFGMVVRRIVRRRAQKSTPEGELWAILVLTVVFVGVLVVTIYRIRTTVVGNRQLHYTLTSEAVGMALDDRYFEAAIDSAGGVAVVDRMTVRNASTKDPLNHFELRYALPDHPEREPARLVRGGVREIPCGGGHKLKLTTRPIREVYLTTVEVYPPLRPGDEATMLQALEKQAPARTMAMTEDSAAVRNRSGHTQAVSFEVRYPTSKLTLKVLFPSGFEPSDPQAVVWYGQARVRHDNEWEHVRSHGKAAFTAAPSPINARMEATLVVDYPLMGLTYGIAWRPPETWMGSR